MLTPGRPAPAGTPTVRVPLYILHPDDLIMWMGLVRKVLGVLEYPNPRHPLNLHPSHPGLFAPDQLDMFYGHRTLVRVSLDGAQRPFMVTGGATDGVELIRHYQQRNVR